MFSLTHRIAESFGREVLKAAIYTAAVTIASDAAGRILERLFGMDEGESVLHMGQAQQAPLPVQNVINININSNNDKSTTEGNTTVNSPEHADQLLEEYPDEDDD